MTAKRKLKYTPTDISAIISFFGTMLMGAILRCFVIGLGLVLIFSSFISPELSLPDKFLVVAIGIIFLTSPVFTKVLSKKISARVATKSPKTHKRLLPIVFIGGAAIACLFFLPSAVYWTSSAVNASVVKSKDTTTKAKATTQTWKYPFMLNFQANGTLGGRSSSTQQVTVIYTVDNKDYSTTTMVHMPGSLTETTDVYYDPLNPKNVVTDTLWSASVSQAIKFDSITIALILSSGFMIGAYLKDRNFLYTEKSKQK
ncbi:MAG: hypothetical protein ACOH18_00620 [Candidatus Saccharimonadaceae bacterium]